MLRRVHHGIAAGVCGAALFTCGVALAGGNPAHPNNGKGTTSTTSTTSTTTGKAGPTGGLPAQAKAYGVYCATQSKTHIAGQKGTPFSQCVTAMAKLAKGDGSSPQSACAALSHKHVAGTKGSPFSRCVDAGAKLLQTKH